MLLLRFFILSPEVLNEDKYLKMTLTGFIFWIVCGVGVYDFENCSGIE